MSTLQGMSTRLLLVAGLALTLAVPVGCGGDSSSPPPARPSSRPKKEAPPPVEETVAKEEPVDDYSYVSIGKRDPFRSFIEVGRPLDPGGAPVGPLQMHEIDQYQLRGIVWNIGEPRAMVEDPDGVGHVVELGTLIGKNWGKVTQIKPNALVITEEYRDPIENELIINEVTMRLPDPSEGEQG